MKIVKKSKKPTIKQMSNMASNLRNKFKVYALVDVACHMYSSSNIAKIEYWLSVEDITHGYISIWEETQDKYFELMRSK